MGVSINFKTAVFTTGLVVYFTFISLSYSSAGTLVEAKENENETIGGESESNISLGDLEIGDRVYDPSWQWEFRSGVNYNNPDSGEVKPVVWVVVAKNHYEGLKPHVSLLSEELIAKHAFDNSIERGNLYGSNHWGESGSTSADRGLRPWLNSDGVHEEGGFYGSFSSYFRAAVVETTVPNKTWDDGELYYTKDRVFIPSNKELGDIVHKNTYPIGTAFQYFVEAENIDRQAFLGSENLWYWTRSPSSYNESTMRRVNAGGNFVLGFGRDAHINIGAVRPVVNVKSNLPVKPSANEPGIYLFAESGGPVPLSGVGITVTADVPGGGRVYGGGVYRPGDEVSVMAEAAPAHQFISWTAEGITLSTESTYSFTAEESIMLTANFTKDEELPGQMIYFQNDMTGVVDVWIMEGYKMVAQEHLGNAPGLNWRVGAVNDLNDSGSADLFWENTVHGGRRIWIMNGFTKVAEYDLPAAGARLRMVGLSDLDGDGYSDLILYNNLFGRPVAWLMVDHLRVDAMEITNVNPVWRMAVVGDYTLDGRPNIIWEHINDGRRNYWSIDCQLNWLPGESGNFYVTGPKWSIASGQDLSGNGSPDLVWEHEDGRRSIWLMNGLERVEGGVIGKRDPVWKIINYAN